MKFEPGRLILLQLIPIGGTWRRGSSTPPPSDRHLEARGYALRPGADPKRSADQLRCACHTKEDPRRWPAQSARVAAVLIAKLWHFNPLAQTHAARRLATHAHCPKTCGLHSSRVLISSPSPNRGRKIGWPCIPSQARQARRFANLRVHGPTSRTGCDGRFTCSRLENLPRAAALRWSACTSTRQLILLWKPIHFWPSKRSIFRRVEIL